MDLSVIIVSYNVRHYLEQCLSSVMQASGDIDCEVFVVDNNSADGSCSMVTTEFPEVKLIMNNVNRGFSAANNQALKIAKGKYLLLLNPDTIVKEETFTRCIGFMESHPDAGIVGVKMIDGKGRFLPESKRSIPTPETSFYKMIGFSHLFPRSEKYNRYYLGNLDNSETVKAEILSGAFMFIRRDTFLKTGLLDEDFFMHGEDIDYCYRVLKHGYCNYYYPGTSIIHYKGESTKKEHLNVFIALNRAMLIFVRKHFSKGEFSNYILPIQIAIILRAGLSLVKKFISRIFLPTTDGLLIYMIYRFIALLWGSYKFGEGYLFPHVFPEIIMPFFTIIIVLSIAFFSGYKIPCKAGDAVKGIITGIIIILIFYALLPDNLRFSRAIIIFGGLASLLLIPLWRFLTSFILPGISDNPFSKTRNTIIVADNESYFRAVYLLSSTDYRKKIIGRVCIDKDDMKEEVLGNIDQLREIIRINRIKEVIFTTSRMSASQIIDSMDLISDLNVTIRIAAAGEKYIFGSRYVNPAGELITPTSKNFSTRIWSLFKGLFK
jgi:GT2 family glycosyltransferase